MIPVRRVGVLSPILALALIADAERFRPEREPLPPESRDPPPPPPQRRTPLLDRMHAEAVVFGESSPARVDDVIRELGFEDAPTLRGERIMADLGQSIAIAELREDANRQERRQNEAIAKRNRKRAARLANKR